jgi:Uma2 family endonuclease
VDAVTATMTQEPGAEFDPLREFFGMWNTKLAERYLPLPELPSARYECVNGSLIVSPYERSANSRAAYKLGRYFDEPAHAAGFIVFGSINLTFSPGRWIEPDVTVLHRVPDNDEDDLWVPAQYCTLPVEIISRSSRRRDRIDKPALCAQVGIPFFMQIEVVRRLGQVTVTLLELGGDRRYETVAQAANGQRFEMKAPFECAFDPADLLP